jgi:hypothetical protein
VGRVGAPERLHERRVRFTAAQSVHPDGVGWSLRPMPLMIRQRSRVETLHKFDPRLSMGQRDFVARHAAAAVASLKQVARNGDRLVHRRTPITPIKNRLLPKRDSGIDGTIHRTVARKRLAGPVPGPPAPGGQSSMGSHPGTVAAKSAPETILKTRPAGSIMVPQRARRGYAPDTLKVQDAEAVSRWRLRLHP